VKKNKDHIKNKPFTIFHQNIAGVLNKTGELEIAIFDLKEKNTDVDVLCITETFVKKGEENFLNLQNFKLASSYSREKKRGGTCILLKKSLDFDDLTSINHLIKEKVFEVCGVKIKVLNIIVVCLYRTPDSNIECFFKLLEELFSILSRYKGKIVIAGDFNIDFLGKSKARTQMMEMLLNYNFKCHIAQPTRQKSCIDNIVSNINEVKGKTHSIGLSDHDTAQTIEFSLESPFKENQFEFIYKRDFCDSNIHQFQQCIGSLSFNDVMTSKNTEESFRLLHDTISLYFNLCFPVVKIRISKHNKKLQWITKGLRKSCKTKSKLRFLFYKNRKRSVISEQYKLQFRKYSRHLRNCFNAAKQIHFTKVVNDADNKGKATWNIIKTNSGRSLNSTQITAIQHNDRLVIDPQEIANVFNNYFIDITQRNINQNYTCPFDRVTRTIFIEPTDPHEIVKIIKSLRNTRSVGIDNINVRTLKAIANEIAVPLAHVANLSFEQGHFPTKIKFAIIKPLFKKGIRTDISNYRPVALLPVISKIFEKAMYTRILKYLNKNHILCAEQSGFRKGKSTTHAAFDLVSSVLHALEANDIVVGLFLDLSKAFDFVDHSIILQKMEKYGIRGPALSWLHSYLSERQQITQIQYKSAVDNSNLSVNSASRINHKGVPQGSILGPLLFLLYVNDLPSCIRHHCLLFADDTTIIIKGKTHNELTENISITLTDVSNWLHKNGLCMNTSKTKLVRFATRNSKIAPLNIKMGNEQIEEVTSTMFLGIVIDTYLNWKQQVDVVSTRINKFNFAIRKLKVITSDKTALLVYHSYVASALRYGIVVWGNAINIKQVFIAQKKCVRAIAGVKWSESCRPLFKKYGILTVLGLYIFEMCKFVKLNLELFKQKCNKGKRTLTHKALVAPKVRLHVNKKNSCQMAVRIYNQLPMSWTQLPSRQFFHKLRTFLLTECFYTLEEFFQKTDGIR
jgi:exonuclease III